MGKADRANPFNQWRRDAQVMTTEAYDQFGRQIGIGDFLILEAHGAVVWRVTNTRPVLATNAPPGLVEITLAAVTRVGVQGGAPMAGFIKVRDALEYMSPDQLEGYKREQREGGGEGTQPGNPPAPAREDLAEPPPPAAPADAPAAEPPAGPSRIILP